VGRAPGQLTQLCLVCMCVCGGGGGGADVIPYYRQPSTALHIHTPHITLSSAHLHTEDPFLATPGPAGEK
jgi:hypothetical protein